MRIVYTINSVQVIGHIWLPDIVAAYEYRLTDRDVDQCKDEKGEITREGVRGWLDKNAGDFRSIDDFAVNIEGFTSDWAKEESESFYYDACFGEEE